MFYTRFLTAVTAGLLGAQRALCVKHGEISQFDGKNVRWQELAKGVFTVHKRSAVELDIDEIVGNSTMSDGTQLESRDLAGTCRAGQKCVVKATNYVLLLGYSAWLITAEYVSSGNLWEFLNKPFVANAGGVAIAGIISGQINEATKKECSTESPDTSQADIIRTALESVIDKNTEAGEVSIDISGPSGTVNIKIKAGPPNTSPNPECNQG
ncbi:hypothetical protein H9Q69_006462 [Fusarium xylarioides]|nr:hypothetical protein H9Q69_006462 [Fusarium xylarioides]